MNRTGIIMVLVAIALAMSVASATDWQQFQKDEINIGWTPDAAPVIKPQLVWSHDIGGDGHAGIEGTPIVGGGTTFVLNHTGWLHAFYAKTGEPVWDPVFCNLNPGNFEVSTPAYYDGLVYVATSKGNQSVGHGRVTAIYAGNGTIREQVDLGEGLSGFQLNTPVTYADGRIYVGNWKGGATHTEDNGTYYCLDASNVSDVIWNVTAPYCTGYYWAGAAIVGEYVIFGDDSANVTCLYTDNGTLVDYINVSTTYGISANEIRSSIVWNDESDRVYFSSKGGYAFAVGFDQMSGQFNTSNDWDTPYAIGYSTSTPVVYDDRVYVGQGGFGATGKVYCLDESDGSEIWSTPNLGGVQSSPAVSVWNDSVYIYFTINNANGSAYCLEDMGSTYTTRWVWNPPAPDDQYIMQGMAISDGMVYFGTDEGYIYALQEETPYEIDIDTSVALNGDVNISWSGNASRIYDIYITDTYPNFGTTPAETGITVNHWIDAAASDHPKQRYYKVAYSGSKPGVVSDTVGYYNATAECGPGDVNYTLLSVPHPIVKTDINDVLKYNHAPGQRLHGEAVTPWRDYVVIRDNCGTRTATLDNNGIWQYLGDSFDLPSDRGFKVVIRDRPGHTVPTNVVFRMLMRDTLGDLIVN